MQNQYLTGNEAAALLGVNRRRLYRWMERGVLRADEWTREQLEARKAELLNPPKQKPTPRCAVCGDTNPDHFTPRPRRPSGFDGYCRQCNADRMWRSRQNPADDYGPAGGVD